MDFLKHFRVLGVGSGQWLSNFMNRGQGCNEVRWRLGQEASLAPPCSKQIFWRQMQSTLSKKVLLILLGLFDSPRSYSAPSVVIWRPIVTLLLRNCAPLPASLCPGRGPLLSLTGGHSQYRNTLGYAILQQSYLVKASARGPQREPRTSFEKPWFRFRVQVQGLGFRVQGLGLGFRFRVQVQGLGLGFRFRVQVQVQGLGFR